MRRLSLLCALLCAAAGAQRIPPAPSGITDPYQLAEYAGALHGLPQHLMEALVQAESAGNPRALSSAGAVGLTQLMPGTARMLGVTDPWNVWQNAYGGAKYLRQQLDTFGRLDHAVAAYNAGPGNVRQYKGVPPFSETQKYVAKVTTLFSLFSGARLSPQVSPAPPARTVPSTPTVPTALAPGIPESQMPTFPESQTPAKSSVTQTRAAAPPVAVPQTPPPAAPAAALVLSMAGLGGAAPTSGGPGNFTLNTVPLGGQP